VEFACTSPPSSSSPATSDVEANLATAERLIRRAAGYGAQLIATPENTNFLGPHHDKVRLAEPLDGPTVHRFAALARELGIHLLIGSFNEASPQAGRCYNTSVLLGPDGAINRPPTASFTCSTSTSPTRFGSASPTPSSPATRRWWSDTPLGSDRPVDLLRPALPRAVPSAGRRRARRS
jgi:hypothetical protein